MTDSSAVAARSMIVLSMPLLMGCPVPAGAEVRTRWARRNWRRARTVEQAETADGPNASAPRERLHWAKARA